MKVHVLKVHVLKVHVLSDLHLEFMTEPDAYAFVRRLPRGGDVLVLAGDVSNAVGIKAALQCFAGIYPRIVFVAGNHEFYGSSPDVVEATLRGVPANVHVLENSWWTSGHDGLMGAQRFVGCSLWFPQPTRGDATCLNDFRLIRDFEPWVYRRNRESVKYLEETIRPDDVVVTHHLPAPESVHAKYRGSALNDFFLCDMERLIQRVQPKIWIHGHTHESADYWIGKTRVICNPYGYDGHEVNGAFDAGKMVEIPK